MNYFFKKSLNHILENFNFANIVLQISKRSHKEVFQAAIILTDNEIKDIIKVIKSLENRGILSKGTTRKITSQEGRFFNFLRLLMTAGWQRYSYH